MRRFYTSLALLLMVAFLAACGGQASDTASAEAATASTPEPYSSAVLVTTYQDALPASSQLALGILKLEGTADAVTSAQAKTLLPLWQAVNSGVLQDDAETGAVLKQIEAGLQAEQLQAIAAMQLTMEDLAAYGREAGLGFGASPGGTPPAGGLSPSGGAGGPGNMTEEQRQAFRATAEAGGMPAGGPGQGAPGQGAPGEMTEEQQQAFRATAEAGGFPAGGPRGGGGGGNAALTGLARAVVDLLTERTAQ